MKKISFLLLFLFSCFWGFSQIWDENFNYGTTVDTLDNPTKGGVNWKKHSGVTPMVYNVNSLSFTNYPLSGVGGSAEILNQYRQADLNRSIPAVTSGSVYASFLFKMDSISVNNINGDYFFHFADTFGATSITNFKGRVYVKYGGSPNTYKIGLTKGPTSGLNFTSVNYSFGSTYLVVLKYKFDLSALDNDSVFAYIFDSNIPAQEPLLANLAVTDVSADLPKIQSVCLRQGSNLFKGYVDGLRVSTTWNIGSSPSGNIAASVTVGAGGDYTSFTNAGGLFEAINSLGLNQNTVATVIGNTNELGTHSLNQFAPNYSLTIKPNAATLRTIEMASPTRASDSLFIFNGADNVIIDGSFNGSGKYLLFRCANANQDSTGSVFSLVNDAREISVSNCILESNSKRTNSAVITIGGTNLQWGNDGFNLYGNLIREATGTNTGGYVSAYQNSTPYTATYAQRNSRVVFRNNQFTGFRSTSLGINILVFSQAGDSIVIDSNQFYKGSNFAIPINQNLYGVSIDNGKNVTITNNSFGGSSPNRSGEPISIGNQFIAVNINTTDTGCLSDIRNNKVGNIVGTRGQSDINGIWVRGDRIIVENNIIGGLQNPWDTIQGGGLMLAVYIDGFTKPDTAFVRGNIVSHIKYLGKVSKSLIGLSVSKIVSNSPDYLICHDNLISDLFSNSLGFNNGVSGALTGLYINLSPNGTRDVFVYNNTIKNLSHRTDTSRFYAAHIAGLVYGLTYNGGASANYKARIYNNKIYNLTALNTNVEDTGLLSTQVSGLSCYQISGGNVSIYNNQVSLVSNNTSPVRYLGILCNGNSTNFQGNLRIVHNSVLLSGNSVANGPNGYSAAFSRELKQTIFVRNNIFVNARSGNNTNFAIVNDSLAANWVDTSCQHNLYVSNNSNQMGLWANRTNPLTFAAWKSASNSDTASTYYTTSIIDPANFFTNFANCDLSIKSAMRSYAAGKGYPENSVTNDYLNNTRSATTPSVGAFEYPLTPPPPVNATIKVNQIIPEYGMVGSTVTIKGLGFNTPASDNIVLFGNIKASITSGNDSTLVVTVPLGAKASELIVENQANGLSASSEAIFRPMFAPQKISLTEVDFLPAKAFTIATDSRNIITADFDGDGKLDVAGASGFPDSLVSILRNTSNPGQITFAPNVTMGANGRMNRIYANDLNGDGKPEVITSNFANGGISIFPNTSTLGSISFGTRIDYVTGNNPVTIVFDDFDGNGKPDIAVTNQLGSSLSVLRNTSVGGSLSFVGKNFSPSFLGQSSCMGLTSNDFNNDGKIDLAITFPFANKMKILKNACILDSIHFIVEPVVYTTDTFVRELQSADLNGDGKPEILTYSTSDKKISVFDNLGQGTQFAFNDTFTYTAHQSIIDLRIYNVDGDSKADLALYTADSVIFLKNTSSAGNYSFEYFGSKRLNGSSRFDMADMDNDHKVDLLVTGGNNTTLRVFRHIYPISNNNISGTEVICAAGSTAQINGSTVVNSYLIPYTHQWIKSTTSPTNNYSITSAQDTAINYSPGSISSNTWFKRVYIWDYTYDTTNVAAKTIANLGNNTITGNQQVNAGQNASTLIGSTASISVNYLWLSSLDSLSGYAQASGLSTGKDYNPGIMNQTTYYKRVVLIGTCTDTSSVVKVGVTVGAINNQITSGNQAKCKGANADSVLANLPTGLTAPISYQWIRSTNGAAGPYTAAPGISNLRNYFPGGLNQSIYLKRVAKDASKSDTSGFVFLEAIDLSANTISGNQLILTGQTPSALAGSLITYAGTFNYQWLSANALVGPYAPALGKNDTVNYAPSALTQSTFYKRAVLTAGCKDTSNVVSVIVGTPGINLNNITGTQNLCAGVVSDTLKGSIPVGGNPPYQYAWLSSTTSATAGFGAASGTNNTQNYLAGALVQTTWFKRVAMDGTNSDTSNVVAINITPTPAKPVISTKPLAPICLGTSFLNFGANAAPASGVNYTWTAINAEVYAQGSTKQFSLISFNTAGAAKVILTASANGCSSRDEYAYFVADELTPLATVRYFNKNFVCEANMVNKYQWGYDIQPTLEGAIVNGEINQNYFNAAPDLTGKNYWAISTTANCYQKTYYNKPLDVRENPWQENGLTVYPNPVGKQLSVLLKEAKGSMQVQVLDMHGKICHEVFSVQTETTIDMEDLAPGVYLVRCILENDVVVNTKVVKN